MSRSKGSFQCFGCKAKGNILEFVADMEGLDRAAQLRDAAKLLATIASVPLSLETGPRARPEKSSSRNDEGGRRETPSPAPRKELELPSLPKLERLQPLKFVLQNVDPEHAYLEERGIDPKLAEEFGIGFYRGKGSMHDRIVFPIHDWWDDAQEPSRLVAYCGRIATDEASEDAPKYLIPEGFAKHQTLYLLNRVAGSKHVYVVEGFFDAIRMLSLGFPTVAIMGTSISPEQAELLWRANIRHTTIMFDGDVAGRAASLAASQVLSWRGLFTRIVHLPDDTDPANAPKEVIRKLHSGS